MSKRPSLAESLRGVAAQLAPPPPAEPPPREPQSAPSPAPAMTVAAEPETRPKGFYAATRAGKKKATASLSMAAHRQLKALAVEQGGTVEGLLIEAINDLFRKHAKQPIA